MSRQERRAYQRMVKKQDPFAPPAATAAARARADAQRARQAPARRATQPSGGQLLAGRAQLWIVGGALAAFLLGLSLAWRPNGGESFAVVVGIGAGIVWIVASLAFLAWRRREQTEAANQRPRQAGPR
jgi:hypothetical protein